ncbi:unnamed protein product [Sphagnum jensenii]|uniref:Major facilitator superfamily (MFS) profile domain-containing protein n=1 Tax=Sphagnum jensenii TaxID=128206 RepID=A0ABP1C1N8_9BRYO
MIMNVGSAFMVVRVATAVSWGIAADKYGRKPILLISLISVFVMIYGFVNSHAWLILMVQAYASEISNARHQALGVSIVQSPVSYFAY